MMPKAKSNWLSGSTRDMRLGTAAVLLLALLGVWQLTRPKPNAADVDGTYTNSCCQPVKLYHGAFIFGTQRVPFTINNMKYGLIAHPQQHIAVLQGSGIVAGTSANPDVVSILFDEDHRGFTLPGPGQSETHFRRQP